MMSPDLYQAFQRCLVLAQSGVPLEECLARHPAHARELRPLLLAATSSSDRLSGAMPPEVRGRVRQRVMDHWERTRSPRKTWSLRGFLPVRWAAAAATVILLILGGGAGTVAAAQDATPATALYPVKELKEEARLWFTRSPEEKVTIYSEYARERVREVVSVSQNGPSTAAQISLSRLEEHLTSVDRLIADVPPGDPSVQYGRLEIIETLEHSLATQEPDGEVSEDPVIRPQDAYPCLQHTLQIIRQAREQVHSALDNVGRDFPTRPDRSTTKLYSFCPP